MNRYRVRVKEDTYDTGFPLAIIGIAMLALTLSLAIGDYHESAAPKNARVFVPVAVEHGGAK